MKKSKTLIRNLVTAMAFGAVSLTANAGALPVSATILEFAEENTLFVADSDGGQILAYTLPVAQPAKASASYNLEGAGTKIAQLAG